MVGWKRDVDDDDDDDDDDAWFLILFSEGDFILWFLKDEIASDDDEDDDDGLVRIDKEKEFAFIFLLKLASLLLFDEKLEAKAFKLELEFGFEFMILISSDTASNLRDSNTIAWVFTFKQLSIFWVASWLIPPLTIPPAI